jgi:hypothetical protein
MTRRHQLTPRVKGHRHRKISEVPTNTPAVPFLEGSPPDLPSRRLGPTTSPNKEGQTYVDPTVGGVILGGRSNSTQGILTPRNQRRHFPQCMEHRAAKEILSLVSLSRTSSRLCKFFSSNKCHDEAGLTRLYPDAQGLSIIQILS